MLSVFLTCTTSKPPVILLPGLYGSALTATYEKGFAKHWYCSSTMDHSLFWVDYKLAIPPVYNCLFDLIRGYYDPETKKVGNPPGLSTAPPDFGGEQGLAYVDQKGIFGMHFIESFHGMLEYLKGKGYTIKKDLYGAPYNWHLAMAGLSETFFPQLKNLIEEAYNNNENQKVTVLGYSCGGLCIQKFFSLYCDQEWKDKYIAKAIFLAPAYGGSMDTFDVSWNRYFPILPILKSDTIQQTIEQVPCIHSLYPNVNVFGNKTLVRGPNGEEYKAEDIPDFLVAQGKFHEENIPLMREDVKVTHEQLLDPKVPLMMLFNTAVKTRMTVDFKNGYDKDPETIYDEGDGTVPAIGPKYGCEHWGSTKYPLHCVDVNQANEDDFDHVGMSTNAAVHDKIYEYIMSNDWIQNKKSLYITLPHIETRNNATEYTIKGAAKIRELIRD